MDFRIADTFTSALSHLTAQEQKAVKTTAFDLQLNPAVSGMTLSIRWIVQKTSVVKVINDLWDEVMKVFSAS